MPKKETAKKPGKKVVSVKEFNEVKDSVDAIMETQDKMLDILNNISMDQDDSEVKGDVEEDVSSEDDGGPVSMSTLPPEYQAIFDTHFNPKDGFTGALHFPGAGEAAAITFSISVPEIFSNASEAHRTFYKEDIRMVALHPTNISQDIEDYCKRVIKNLSYVRNRIK